jgi:hypothetical protein
VARSRRWLVSRRPQAIFVVADVRHVHPRMPHFVDGAVAKTNPLVRIRIVLVGAGVVVPRAGIGERQSAGDSPLATRAPWRNFKSSDNASQGLVDDKSQTQRPMQADALVPQPCLANKPGLPGLL